MDEDLELVSSSVSDPTEIVPEALLDLDVSHVVDPDQDIEISSVSESVTDCDELIVELFEVDVEEDLLPVMVSLVDVLRVNSSVAESEADDDWLKLVLPLRLNDVDREVFDEMEAL